MEPDEEEEEEEKAGSVEAEEVLAIEEETGEELTRWTLTWRRSKRRSRKFNMGTMKGGRRQGAFTRINPSN